MTGTFWLNTIMYYTETKYTQVQYLLDSQQNNTVGKT